MECVDNFICAARIPKAFHSSFFKTCASVSEVPKLISGVKMQKMRKDVEGCGKWLSTQWGT